MRSAVLSIAAACALFAIGASANSAVVGDLSKRDDYSSYSYGIEDWKTCHPGKDSCSNSHSKCCIAKADKHSGKYTCRPAGKDCDDYSTEYYDDSYSSDYSDTYYDDYSSDYSSDYSDDSYSSDYYGARSRHANGARRAKAGHGRPHGLMHSKAYDDYYGVADWKTCHPSSETCSNPSAKCCIAKADKSSGKYTCRPHGQDCDGSDYYDSSYSSDYYDDSTYYDDSYSSDYYDDSYSTDYYDDSYSGDYYDDYSSDYYGETSSTYYEPSGSDYYGARSRHAGARHARPAGHRARPAGHRAPARGAPAQNPAGAAPAGNAAPKH